MCVCQEFFVKMSESFDIFMYCKNLLKISRENTGSQIFYIWREICQFLDLKNISWKRGGSNLYIFLREIHQFMVFVGFFHVMQEFTEKIRRRSFTLALLWNFRLQMLQANPDNQGNVSSIRSRSKSLSNGDSWYFPYFPKAIITFH